MKWILMMLAVLLVIGSVQVEKLTQLCCSEMRLDVDIITQLYTPHSYIVHPAIHCTQYTPTSIQLLWFIPCSEWSMGLGMRMGTRMVL